MMEETDFKIQELKLKLKTFELEFIRSNNRKPTKEDINLDDTIKHVYGSYWKLHKDKQAVRKDVETDIWKLSKPNGSKCSNRIKSNQPVSSSFTQKLWRNSSNCSELKNQSRGVNKSKETITPVNSTLVNVVPITESVLEEVVEKQDSKSSQKVCDENISVDIFKKKHYIKSKRFVTSKTMGLNRSPSMMDKSYDISWLDKCETANSDLDISIVNNSPQPILIVNETPVESEITVPNESVKSQNLESSIKTDFNNFKNEETKNLDISMVEASLVTHPINDKQIDNTKEANPQNNQEQHSKKRAQEKDSVFDFINDSSLTRQNKKPKLDSEENNTPEKPSASKISKQPRTKSVPRSSKSSGNFVRLNLRKKCFSRGQGRRNLPHKYKMMKYKNRQNTGNCFKCGQPGHWANKCTFQTDEEPIKTTENPDTPDPEMEIDESVENPESNTEKLSIASKITPNITTMKPFYNNIENKFATDDVLAGLKKMGHKEFRDFQEIAVMRILNGQSTLLVLPTGSGKSLCYQLPAYIYSLKEKCITLVISPLVSLMEDQVKGLPRFLQSVFLHSGMTSNQRQKTIESIKQGDVKILLLSPEFILSSHNYLLSFLPTIAFVCIDEAHCLSEWSHNFRPSYLQLIKIVKEQMGVNCLLALTATATKRTIRQIKSQIGLQVEDSVIGETAIPTNLHFSVSCDINKDEVLLNFVNDERFQNGSLIIYCTRREETERVATRLRIKFLDDFQKGGSKTECHEVSSYHAGVSPSQRRTIQKKFMSDKMRVVVATVAFGMGLNKSNVRGIIHYNMPKSFESYVQEVGRAGRDGLPAYCHLFLDEEGKDYVELRRHIYGNSLDRHVARKLLNHAFKPCSCDSICHGHNVAFPIAPLVEELDVREENITTLMCYLELDRVKWLEVLPHTMSTCTIRCYKGEQQFEKITKTCEPIAVARKLNPKQNTKNSMSFNYVTVASERSWDPILVRRALKQLEFSSIGGTVHRSGVMVEFSNLSFHIKRRGDYTNEEKDQMLNLLYEKVVNSENRQLKQLAHVFHTFQKYSETDIEKTLQDNALNSNGIKDEVMKYFNSESDYITIETDCLKISRQNSLDVLRRDIRSVMDIHHDRDFTGRQIAQIFYGIGSPRYPAEVWGRDRRFWRAHMEWEFNQIVSVANDEILARRLV